MITTMKAILKMSNIIINNIEREVETRMIIMNPGTNLKANIKQETKTMRKVVNIIINPNKTGTTNTKRTKTHPTNPNNIPTSQSINPVRIIRRKNKSIEGKGSSTTMTSPTSKSNTTEITKIKSGN